MGSLKEPVIDVENLWISFEGEEGRVEAVRGISFHLHRGEVLCLVGESGSGKTVTGMSLPRLLPRPPAEVRADRMRFNGRDLLELSFQDMQSIRGAEIGCIFQEPMTALSPLQRVGDQLIESLLLHRSLTSVQARAEALYWLRRVGIPDPERRMMDFPFQYSGGMRQRVMIAMALMLKPDVLIADEPTTALDVTTQEQIFKLMLELKDEDTALLFITHDMGVVWELADRVLVMKEGRVVEEGPVEEVFGQPREAYTQDLIQAVPRIGSSAKVPTSVENDSPLLEIRDLQTWFPVREGWFSRVKRHIRAVDGVSLKLYPGRTTALVGESGSGKSTLGRTLLQLERARGGMAEFKGRDLLSGDARAVLGSDVQVVFQDPYSSLNPRMTIQDAITEPLRIRGLLPSSDVDRKACELLEQVELNPAVRHRYPHEFSGGQRQRICIARSLSVNPELILCDEAVSGLDVTLQSRVIDLLMELQARYNIAYLFITHDLSRVKQIADYVVVMKDGRFVEEGLPGDVIDHPQHPYTQALVSAVPRIGESRKWKQAE